MKTVFFPAAGIDQNVPSSSQSAADHRPSMGALKQGSLSIKEDQAIASSWMFLIIQEQALGLSHFVEIC